MGDDLKNIGNGRESNALAVAAVYLIGLVSGLVLMTGVNHFRKQPVAITYAPCGMCHKAPILNTAKKYAQWHRATPPQRIGLLVKWGQS